MRLIHWGHDIHAHKAEQAQGVIWGPVKVDSPKIAIHLTEVHE